MVTIAQLLTWESEPLETAADGLYALRKQLIDLQDEVDDSRVPGTWWGDAATAATKAHGDLVERLRNMTAEVVKVATSLDFAGGEVKAARDSLQAALDEATKQGFDVDRTTGEVSDPHTYENTFESLGAGVQVTTIAQNISDALNQATEADADLARALVAANEGKVDGGDGSLSGAADQLPAGLDGMTPEEIAARYGDGVAFDTFHAWISLEAEIASWEIEGFADATYKVMGDGKVVMALTLEGGLGREIDVGGAELDASAGATTSLELTFEDQAAADKFLADLDDAARDLGWRDIGNIPAAVLTNVAQHVMDQNVTSFRAGVYGKVGAEFETAFAKGEGEARVDAYYDFAKGESGLKISASADAELGKEGSGVSGSAALSGDVTFKGDDIKEVVFDGKISASVANEKLGLDLPAGTSTGQGVDVQLKMSDDNPAFDDFDRAMRAGDLDGAVDIAYNDAEVTVRSTTTESYASEEHDYDIKLAELEFEYGAEGEVANRVWVRQGGEGYWVDIDPKDVRR